MEMEGYAVLNDSSASAMFWIYEGDGRADSSYIDLDYRYILKEYDGNGNLLAVSLKADTKTGYATNCYYHEVDVNPRSDSDQYMATEAGYSLGHVMYDMTCTFEANLTTSTSSVRYTPDPITITNPDAVGGS